MTLSAQMTEILDQGGAVTRWVAILAAIALSVAAERLVVFHRASTRVNLLLAELRQQLVGNRSIRDALKVCDSYRGPLVSIMKSGLLQYGRPRDDIDSTMKIAAIHETRRLEKHLLTLTALSAIIPTLGLAGTLMGWMDALNTLATQEAVTDSALFAGEISRALIPVTAGVVLTLPMLLLNTYFKSRLRRYVTEFETSRNWLLGFFGEMEREGLPPESENFQAPGASSLAEG